ncbi:MAG: heme o synthase [Rhodothermia bacterium]|nr:MAG: heme o synthase [Rhodothermia bacterium]
MPEPKTNKLLGTTESREAIAIPATSPSVSSPISSPPLRVVWKQRLVDYVSLAKPEITFLVTISALAGFVLGSANGLDGWTLGWALIGISLVSAGGGALNHYLERTHDRVMRRTSSRPLPSGRIRPESARTFGYVLIAVGLSILCPLTNPLTGVLAAISVALYLYVYTPLKRITPYNTIVGTIPGALPALGGWTAATGNLDVGGWAIFMILLAWQMPHFLSLAWMYRKDYERAGFSMWTVGDETGTRTTRLTLAFSILMIAASVVPWMLNLSGTVYVTGSLILGAWFMIPVIKFCLSKSVHDARLVLMGSVKYIPLLLLLIFVDRWMGL